MKYFFFNWDQCKQNLKNLKKLLKHRFSLFLESFADAHDYTLLPQKFRQISLLVKVYFLRTSL